MTGSSIGLLGILTKNECHSPARQTTVGTPSGTKANPAIGLLVYNYKIPGQEVKILNGKVAVPALRFCGVKPETNPRNQC